jgi:hypothetical protein
MIDTFSLALTHALLALTAWRLFKRPDLNQDGGEKRTIWGRRPDA